MKTSSKNSPQNSFSAVEMITLVVGFLVVLCTVIGTALGIYDLLSRSVVFFMEGFLAIVTVFGIRYLWKKYSLSFSRIDVIALGIIFAAGLLAAIFHHDIPLGRDDMGYMSAAVSFADAGSLAFEDVITRPYHPFRVVDGDTFTSQFLPGYSVYLALWYVLFGLGGLMAANSVLLVLFLMSLYSIARRIMSDRAGLLTTIFTATSYVYFWFPRRTLSENLVGVCLWLAVLFMVIGVGRKRFEWVVAGLFPVATLFLIRGEGIAFVLMYLLVAIGIFLWFRRTEIKIAAAPSVFLTLLGASPYVLLSIFNRRFTGFVSEFATQSSSSLLNFLIVTHILLGAMITLAVIVALSLEVSRYSKRVFKRHVHAFDVGIVLTTVILAVFEMWYVPYMRATEMIDWSYYKSQFVLENFTFYHVMPFAVVGFFGLMGRKRYPLIWIPVLLLLPGFVFVIEPSIAVDQPWFMRRFIATLVPLSFLLAGVTLASIVKTSRQRMLLIIIAVMLNFSIAWPLMFHVDHQGVGVEMKDFAGEFSPNDLVLMDPGWKWQQWGYALHYVYGVRVLPNWDRFSEGELFSLIHESSEVFVISAKRTSIYPLYEDKDLELIREWEFSYPKLVPTTHLTSYVDDEKRNLSMFKIRSEQKGTPPREIEVKEELYYVYRVRTGATPVGGVIEGYQTF